ncbi:MAG: sigma-70 family RNA polymerase sigma factor [Bacteroidales bacterium]|nr:sigma-70 family RNA polymerase sigma factor [Bacteroidales bacterium]
MNWQDLSDDALIELFQSGNHKAFEILFKRYKPKVYSYLLSITKNRELALDMLQDVFFKVIETLKKNSYQHQGKFAHWLMRITHNLVMDHFRSISLHYETSVLQTEDESYDINDIIRDNSMNIDQIISKQESYEQIRELLKLLPPEQQEIVRMRIYEEMSFKEIAATLNISINTALGRMRYALINLRKLSARYQMQFN